jgi:hypothetical protein
VLIWFKITPVEIVLVSLAGDLKVLTFLHNFLIVEKDKYNEETESLYGDFLIIFYELYI